MKRLYLILAIIGAVVPYLFFAQYFIANKGFNLMGAIADLFANPAAGGFTADLLTASLIFWIVMLYEYRKNKGPHPLIFIILNLLIGLSCALAAYLYAREGKSAN